MVRELEGAEKNVPVYQHWTPKGVFRVLPLIRASGLSGELWFDEQNLGEYFSLEALGRDLVVEGKYDAVLGFSPKELRVPRNPKNWNGFR